MVDYWFWGFKFLERSLAGDFWHWFSLREFSALCPGQKFKIVFGADFGDEKALLRALLLAYSRGYPNLKTTIGMLFASFFHPTLKIAEPSSAYALVWFSYKQGSPIVVPLILLLVASCFLVLSVVVWDWFFFLVLLREISERLFLLEKVLGPNRHFESPIQSSITGILISSVLIHKTTKKEKMCFFPNIFDKEGSRKKEEIVCFLLRRMSRECSLQWKQTSISNNHNGAERRNEK